MGDEQGNAPKIALTNGYTAAAARSIITDPAYKSVTTITVSMRLALFEGAGAWWQVGIHEIPYGSSLSTGGDKINKAIEKIATNQMKAGEAMKEAQAEAIADLRKAGNNVSQHGRLLQAAMLAKPVTTAAAFGAYRQTFYWRLLWPTLVVLIIVTLLPTLYLIVTSFTPLNLTRPGTAWDFSQPLQNYVYLLEDKRLHGSFWVRRSCRSGP